MEDSELEKIKDEFADDQIIQEHIKARKAAQRRPNLTDSTQDAKMAKR